MPAESVALLVTGAHVEVAVKIPVLGVDGAHQGDDFIDSLKAVGVIGLGRGVKDADGEVLHSTQSGDGGQFDLFLFCEDLQLGQDLLVPVQADDVGVPKFPVFHDSSSCF